MIPDEMQDQAALYSLDLLDASERLRFEAAMRENEDLRALVRELREASADLALSVPTNRAPAALKQSVLREIALEKQSGRQRTFANWLPWAIAALFLVFGALFALDRARLQRELAELRATDPLARAAFVSLTSPTGELPQAKAVIVWQADKQSGVITISHLPPAAAGHDYQLWTIDAKRADPISAGVIHVEANGLTHIRFKPSENASQVKAFAISVEREGGAPKPEGPIILIGNA